MSKHNLFRLALCLCGTFITLPALAQYEVEILVSDTVVGDATVDPLLVNPWGIAMSPTGPFWISNNGTSTSTLYDGEGEPQPPDDPLVVAIPPADSAPTGIEFYGGQAFKLGNGTTSGPSRFIFVTESGTIAGWNPKVDLMNAITVVDNSARDANYKGVAVGTVGGKERLFVANFHSGRIEVYDSSFRFVGSFTDKNLPADYAPFGIEAIGNEMVVTFAKHDDEDDDVPGPGNGYVDVFHLNAAPHFVVPQLRRLISRGALNAPWGIVRAPKQGFGPFSGALLIGNFGDGKINAYTRSGAFLGTLRDMQGQPIVIDGLWGLTFGNGVMSDEDDLYFTAGPGDETHGLFGEIKFGS